MSESATDARVGTSPDRRTGQAYILFGVSLILVATLGAAVQMAMPLSGLVFTEIALILIPAIVFVRRKRLPIAAALRWRTVSAKTALLSIAVGISSWGVAAGIAVLVQPLIGEPPSIPGFNPETLQGLLWVLLVAALLPGICEETLFRGAIQGILSRRGPQKAVVFTALLFAIFHINPWSLVSAFFLGLVFGTVLVRTGSTVPAMLAHISNNVVAFTMVYIFGDQPRSGFYMLMGGLAVACCVTFPLFWMYTRREVSEPSPLAAVPAGVERPQAWLIGLVGGSIGAIILAAVVAAFTLIELHTMPDDALSPQIQRGDQLVIFKSRMVELDLEAGDIVSYHRDGETVLQEIVRVGGDSIWVHDGDAERHLLREEIVGKVVHSIRSEESSRQDQAFENKDAR